MHALLSAVLLSSCVLTSSLWATTMPPVIYGEDNRLDYYALNARTQAMADATAVLVDDQDVHVVGDSASLKTKSYSQEYGLCTSEPFYNQETTGYCTGFLVAPDVMVTAGHCVDEDTCRGTRFVFGFSVAKENEQPRSVSALNVYSCQQVIHREQDDEGADFAVVRLDRAVISAKPLSYRSQGTPNLGTALTVVGYPAGLPVKAADGASVLEIGSGFFVTDTDTYGGNSGSPVFNDQTGEVEGVLVRGAQDYVRAPKGNCSVSNICTKRGRAGCDGESVTLFQNVAAYLK